MRERVTLRTPDGGEVVFEFGVQLGHVVMVHPVDGGRFKHSFTADEARVVVGMLQHQVDVLEQPR